jgi:hypothetical protein
LLLKVLRSDQRAIVSMPSEEDEVDDFIEAINMKYPALTNCWGAMVGLKVWLEKAGNSQIQNIFFNGWTYDHYVNSLFLFSLDGKKRACYIYAPGTMHDSTMANWGGLYEKVDDLYTSRGAKIVVDLAFASDRRQSVYKSYQSNIDNQGNVRQILQIQRQATLVRQMSEWGMRGLQASFPRLNDRIIYEENGERRLIKELFVYLYNYRAAAVAMNQIQSVYMPWPQQSANNFLGAI